jgi:hypothetical protein
MLRFAYDMYVSDKSHFGATAGSEWVENEKIELTEKYGWIDIKSGVTTINFRPSSLRVHLIKSLGSNKDGANRAETSVSSWVKLGISNGTRRVIKGYEKEELLKTTRIRTAFNDRQSVVQIPLTNFYKYLGIEEDGLDGGNNSAQENEGFSTLGVPVTGVNARLHENITVHGSSSDLYNVLMGDLGDDD